MLFWPLPFTSLQIVMPWPCKVLPDKTNPLSSVMFNYQAYQKTKPLASNEPALPLQCPCQQVMPGKVNRSWLTAPSHTLCWCILQARSMVTLVRGQRLFIPQGSVHLHYSINPTSYIHLFIFCPQSFFGQKSITAPPKLCLNHLFIKFVSQFSCSG